MTTLSPSLRRSERVIRENGGTVKMRRLDGHCSPWRYMAGTYPIPERDIRGLQDAGRLVQRPQDVPGSERYEFRLVTAGCRPGGANAD